MNCENSRIKIFSFVANFFAVAIAVSASFLLFFGIIPIVSAALLVWILLAIAVAVGILLLGFVMFRCFRACHEAQPYLCKYAGIIASGIIGTIIFGIISLIIQLFSFTVLSAIIFGLLILAFAIMIANILTYSYAVFTKSCDNDDDDCCHKCCRR